MGKLEKLALPIVTSSILLVAIFLGCHYKIHRDNGKSRNFSEEVRRDLFNKNPSTIFLTVFPSYTIHDKNGDGEADYTAVQYPPVRGIAVTKIRKPTQEEIEWYRNN